MACAQACNPAREWALAAPWVEQSGMATWMPLRPALRAKSLVSI